MSDHAPINPLLRAALPGMIDRLAQAQLKVRETLAPIAVDMQAVSDFLDFEIQRTQLELDRAEWSSRADTETIDERGRYLRGLLKGVEYDINETVADRLGAMADILKRLRDEAD
jgi:hypothetical protein